MARAQSRQLPSSRIAIPARCKGYSLIEAAIVLGIMSMVIAGIWTAYRSVEFSRQNSKAASDVILIANNARRIFPKSMAPATGMLLLNTPAFRAGVFPPDYKQVSGNILHPDWGTSVKVSLWQAGWLVVQVEAPTKAACLSLIAGVTSQFKDNYDLANVATTPNGGSPTNYTTWPMSISGSHCDGALPINIHFDFTFAMSE